MSACVGTTPVTLSTTGTLAANATSGTASGTDTLEPDDDSPDIILQATDSRFWFSLDTLAQYSHFTAGLLSLPGNNSATPTLELPVGAAPLGYTLQCIMDLSHRKAITPLAAKHALEVFTICEILDAPELFAHILSCAPPHDVPSHFLVAMLTDDDAGVYDISPRLLAFSDEYHTRAWWTSVIEAKAPHVLCQLATLFDNWNSSYLYFASEMGASPRTVFSHKHYWLPSGVSELCDQHAKYRGNFAAFHSGSIRPLWDSFASKPLTPPLDRSDSSPELRQLRPQFENIPHNVDMLGIKCSTCRASLAEDVRRVLTKWPVIPWSAWTEKRARGFAVPPSPAEMEAWRVYPKKACLVHGEGGAAHSSPLSADAHVGSPEVEIVGSPVVGVVGSPVQVPSSAQVVLDP